ncbi:MAG: CHAT domain-containing protein, partial [Pseudanabaenales cyanobacterium]|nr:CHAT domain-containing protein [Pseudanabaenales cyanobacterium]
TFDAPVNISSLGVGLTAEAGNTITVNESITTQGGDITLISSNGSITTTDLNTSVVGEGDSGAITLDAGDSINTGDIFTFTDLGNAGMVMLAAGDSINTVNINTNSEEGDGGAITLNASGSITTADLDSSANSGDAGVITLDAGDSINIGDVFTDVSSSFGDAVGNGGMVMLAAGGDINTVSIDTSSEEGASGAITLNASDGITTGDLDSSAAFGDAGAITLDAGDSINTGDIYAHVFDDSGDGGAVMLAAGGGINTVDINTSSNEGDSGAITLNASGGITIADLDSSAALGNAGAITLNASDSITTADIDTGSDSGFGGPVILTSEMGAITTGMINTAGATGGDVVLNAETAITTGAIDTRGTDGDAGDVILDPSGDVQVIYINAESGGGVGGAIKVVTEQFFRATGSFVAQNGLAASISSIGTQGVGDITITHGGGLLGVPFTIGDATTNGTVAAITSGNFTLDASNPNNPFLDSFNLGETAPGNIDLITAAAAAPSLSPNSLDPCFGDCATPRIPELFGDEEVDGRLQLVQAPLTVLPETYAANAFQRFESRFTREFVDYLELDETPESITISQAQTALQNIQSQTGENPALLFVVFGASGTEKTITEETITEDLSSNYRDLNPLELLLITADEDPVYVSVPEATRRQVLTMAQRLRRQVTNPYRVGTTTYLFSAQALYRWLIAPIQADLEEREITNIGFIMDSGLRSAPLAALHDGQRFLVEDYSIGLIPSLGLIDTTYVNIQNAQALVGGASEFIDQNPLPFEPVEIETIQTLWPGQQLQNEDFTVDNLQAQRQQRPYGIIHLSTHGKFSPGALSKSYIQFFDGKLQLDQLRKLGWNDPPVELVTLSACQTALGNREAELGFAGLAVLAGTKSALASLWQVGDEATTGLMVEFYQQLQTAPTKVEALRQAQLAMINGQVLIEANQLRWTGGSIRLPSALSSEVTATLSHPFHWAAFTLVGSPW